MTERERDEARPEADPADPEGGRSDSGPELLPRDPVTPADQAVDNQEQALESGEENVV